MEINNNQDILDSRDIIEKIEELEEINPNSDELQILKSFASEASETPDWEFGEPLIRYSYFKDYAMELAEDCDLLKDTNNWPLNCIDWEKASRELQCDKYFTADFGEITYFVRN